MPWWLISEPKAANNNGTNLAASVPTSGTLTFDNFRGTAKGFKYTFTSGATNQNASTLFGDDYARLPQRDCNQRRCRTWRNSSEEALEVPAGGAGSITITNNGTISGAGGTAGGGTGDAFEAASSFAPLSTTALSEQVVAVVVRVVLAAAETISQLAIHT